MDKVIVLASGGLDSTLVMIKLLGEGYEVVPFFSDYSQYALSGERRAVHGVVEWLKDDTGESLVEVVDTVINRVYPTRFGGRIRDVVEAKINVGIPKIAACPGRILAFTGAATIWAFSENWTSGEIAIGIHSGDKDDDSCRVGYEGDLDKTLKILTQGCMDIITPLMGMSREEMAKELGDSGVSWDMMYNCYWYPPCSWKSINDRYLCPGCRRKKEAIETATGKEVLGPVVNTQVMSSNVARRDWKEGKKKK